MRQWSDFNTAYGIYFDQMEEKQKNNALVVSAITQLTVQLQL